ncbi:MAG: hypothetical protein GY715_02145 [Planctomycetes bacterium]|nr:hypothetical protein [Planctomycetota bacterium]
MTTDESQAWNTRTMIGTIICRVVVPLWILTGVAAKLIESSPRLLPKKMLDDAVAIGIDLNVLLAVIISFELLAVLVIAFIGRVSRVAAAFILAVFCAVLVREMLAGSPSCGCMGSVSPPPWVMLAIDGVMLIGVLAFKPHRLDVTDGRAWTRVAVATLFIAGGVFAFLRVVPMGTDEPPAPPSQTATSNNGPAPHTGPAAPPVRNPAPALPAYYYVSDIETWPGKAWSEIDLLTYVPDLPAGIEQGTHYVVFYSSTCEHCEEMFKKDLASNPGLARQVTAVAIPAKKNLLHGDNPWRMPKTEVVHTQLPLGCDWIISPPLAMEIRDGVVQCAAEGGHQKCLGLSEG